MIPRPVAVGLTILIAIMWAANLTVGYLYPGRSDPYVNAIFAIVCGAVFALGRRTNAGTQAVRTARRRLAEALTGDDGPAEAEPEGTEGDG